MTSEVTRVTSPDGKVDAFVSETDCGATCSFLYEIWLAPKGSRDGERVATLDGATRSEQAWGVNLKWLDANTLSVEYLKADEVTLEKPTLKIAADNIKTSLHGGVTDSRAPAGGMEYNLRTPRRAD